MIEDDLRQSMHAGDEKVGAIHASLGEVLQKVVVKDDLHQSLHAGISLTGNRSPDPAKAQTLLRIRIISEQIAAHGLAPERTILAATAWCRGVRPVDPKP